MRQGDNRTNKHRCPLRGGFERNALATGVLAATFAFALAVPSVAKASSASDAAGGAAERVELSRFVPTTTMTQPVARDRVKLKRSARWSAYFKVPVISFKAGEMCRRRNSLGCVFGRRPPMYVREDVLTRSNTQMRLRGRAARPSAAERRIAVEGINVLLHEWAHARWGIGNEAQADCWAGQWLWDFENEEGFSRSKRALHQKYYWDLYEIGLEVGSDYSSDECYDIWNTAPDLYSSEETSRFDDAGYSIPPGTGTQPPPTAPQPPPTAAFAIARAPCE